MKWKATTETGTTYELDSGYVVVNSDRTGVSVIHCMKMQSAPADVDKLPWVDDSQWRDVRVPVVGERFYVYGLSEWRISTVIVSVEVEQDG